MVQIANGGGDAQGHERGKEYDNMSGLYAVIHPATRCSRWLRKNYGVKFTSDPEAAPRWARAPAVPPALIMAWYHRMVPSRASPFPARASTSSGPFDPKTRAAPGISNDTLIPQSERKHIRL
ncbi:hypothetical protein EMGBS6_15340 [Opitutia bacterium]|nr:hypothetical protein EMGBS6_15340 [Opitutae bacterium]